MSLPRIFCRFACWCLLALGMSVSSADPLGQCGTCSTAFECGEGLKCIGARCKLDDQCCLDEDCPAGQGCERNTCKIISGNVGQCGECSTSFQCGNDLRCSGARCRAEGQCCLDLDCPAGQRCADHQCKAAGGKAGLCGACSTSFECTDKLGCVGARCKDPTQCCFNQDCPSGQSCLQNRCASPAPASARQSSPGDQKE